ncbi:hypothetical protein FOPE_00814 [Fonsecaea pedrosoi]|nr:hypothetical protein FOPE_00814 [Fonsecaea pedrosoi]
MATDEQGFTDAANNNNQNGDALPEGSKATDMQNEYLTRYQTASSVVIPRDVFESMYLSPYTQRLGHLRSMFGNPTPMPLMGFLIASMPLGCNLMGWRGSGGDGAAIICDKAAGAFIFVFCVFGWYLFFTMILMAVDFPLRLPTGDLSTILKGASERNKPEPNA